LRRAVLASCSAYVTYNFVMSYPDPVVWLLCRPSDSW